MTKQEKLSAILATKASAFDELAEQITLCESARSFANKAALIVSQAEHVIKGIQSAEDHSLKFKCIQCGAPATCQVYRGHQQDDPEDWGRPMCDTHALEALQLGEYQIVEEEV